MSEFCKPIEKSFVCRTNKLIQEYDGKYDATMLLNCLLGLLMVPFEKNKELFKNDDRTAVIRDLFNQIQADGRYNDFGGDYSDFEIIRFIRNAIAHFHVESVPVKGTIRGFRFIAYRMDKHCDSINGDCPYKNIESEEKVQVFAAELTIDELKELSGYVKDYVLELVENKRCRNCDYRR